ncbi:MAG TPA: alanine--tRNA ligase [Gammaproteobacteria bacterium]|nr:alanine--tRNA ligase [Gammaproteobacteria bacterium]
MKTNEIRELFLNFFESREHEKVLGSSLIPSNDPTLLFTNAGMVQFKDVFLGNEQRQSQRAVSVQRCLRAGGKHNDLDNVGYTDRHHTFFEMLGNFSFGDYFKEEAIHFAWEFITEELNIDPDRLWVSVFKDDDEAAAIWLDQIKVNPDRLVRMGEASNFWSMGQTGPCGPCTEIFYDHGPHIEGGPPGSESEEGDRFVEIWNLVFMQFERAEDGQLTQLPKPSVDTGMGLERIAAVMQGVQSNYEIDLFKNIIKAVSSLIGDAGSNNHYRVISDHIRAAAFLILDGVSPGREGRGYVLRRIIRRALRHGYELGVEEPFFHEVIDPLVKEMGEAYPDLAQKSEYIKRIILTEEERFSATLAQGMRLLETEIDSLSGDILSGEFVFKLYDTYGFPVDLTSDIARVKQLKIDQKGFDKAMDRQKEMARTASQFSRQQVKEVDHGLETSFLGYDQHENDTKVTGIIKDQLINQIAKGETGQVILEETAFYAESGGQVGDVGTIQSKTGAFQVLDTQSSGDALVHLGTVTNGTMALNDKVKATINPIRRQAITLNHTSAHLLHSALINVLGDHVAQRGSAVGDKRLRLDFSHDQALTTEELRQIEELVNKKIEKNIDVETSIMKHDEALESGALALFGEKYGEEVRVVNVELFSKELCGGTHVKNTGEIGFFKIISESSIASGTRRIEAITGDEALKWAEETEYLVEKLADMLQTGRDGIEKKVQTLVNNNRQMNLEIKDLKAQIIRQPSGDTANEIETINSISLLIKELAEDTEPSVMRSAIDQIKQDIGSGVIILASKSSKGKVRVAIGVTEDLVEKVQANILANEMSKVLGGKGGGRANFANAGGSDTENLLKSFDLAKDWIKNLEF